MKGKVKGWDHKDWGDSRKPDDIPIFVAKMLEEFAEDRGEERRAG